MTYSYSPDDDANPPPPIAPPPTNQSHRQPYKKLFAGYSRNKATKEDLQALEADMGIPISALIQRISGSDAQQVKLQGSWVHPQVAIHIAQWIRHYLKLEKEQK